MYQDDQKAVLKFAQIVFLTVLSISTTLSLENEKPLYVVHLFPETNCKGVQYRITIPKSSNGDLPGESKCTEVGGYFLAKSAKLSGTGSGCRNGSLSSNSICAFGSLISCGKCGNVELRVSSVYTTIPPLPRHNNGHGANKNLLNSNSNRQSLNGKNSNGQNFNGQQFNLQNSNGQNLNRQNFNGQNFNVQQFNGQNSNGQNFNGDSGNGQIFSENMRDVNQQNLNGQTALSRYTTSGDINNGRAGNTINRQRNYNSNAINKKFPGPNIIAQVGDILQVDVYNNIQDRQNVSLHWHGIHQKGTPFEDGPSFVTQCPIKHKHGQTYRVPLTQSGTYWYHSHVGSQYTEGLWGALVVLNRPEVYNYDAEFVITLNDWYHTSAKENEKWFLTPRSGGSPPYPSSALMNGHGRYICSFTQKDCRKGAQKRPVFKLTPGKVYRLRLINTSAWSCFNFAIDGHKLQVIEVDGVDVAPLNYGEDYSDTVFIGPGQRYSFILKNNGGFNRHIIRAQLRDDLIGTSAHNINPNPGALTSLVTGVLEYTNQVTPDQILPMETEPFDYEKFVLPSIVTPNLLNDSTIAPYDRIPAPSRTDREFVIFVERSEDEHHVHHVSFNGTPFSLPKDKPMLMSMMGNEPLPMSTLPLYVEHNSVVKIVVNNPFFGVHPMHLHGHTFWVLGQGERGDGNYSPQTHKLNLHGLKRDTVMLQEFSWVVLKFVADNPGVWAFHCHIDWHNLEGMAMTLVAGSDVARRQLRITDEAKRVCGQHGIII